MAGLEAARARGRQGGRPRALDEGKAKLARRLKEEAEPSEEEICRMLGVGRSTLYKVPEHRLVGLIEMARLHLFREEYWRRTGGWDGGEWLGPEIHPGEEDAEESADEAGVAG